MSQSYQETDNFGRRYYEAIRRVDAAKFAGRTAIGGYGHDELRSYERRQYDEVFSAFVEALNGRVSTHYTFEPVGGRLVAEDGEDIEDLMRRGLDDAEELASSDPFYAQFLPARAKAELEEHLDHQKMAKGQAGFNTIIAFSPFTEELCSPETEQKLKRAGQKPQYKRAMLRLSHWDGKKLHVFTRSLDNSNLNLLRQTAKRALGYEFKARSSTEMLAERLHINIKDGSWIELIDRVVAEADKLAGETRGGDWKQGRPKQDSEDLQQFVAENSSIIRQLIVVGREQATENSDYDSYKTAFEAEFYNYVALMEQRLEKGFTGPVEDIAAAASAAGSVAAAAGRQYDMCGLLISSSEAAAGAATATGFESLRRLENKKVSCPECRQKVVVPKDDLDKGRLTCSDCGFGVDVCTGKVFRKSKTNKSSPHQPDFFERLSLDLKRYDEEERQKRELNRQKELKRKKVKIGA